MNKKYSFSIIIPAYNASDYLAETLDSALNQTFSDFEILVIDDGSTDNTVEVVNRYQKLDPRVKLISQENQGVSQARNTGIQAARGQYLAFLDSDDIWFPDNLEFHLNHFQTDSKLGISFARVEFINPDGSPTGQSSSLRLKNISPYHLYMENLLCTPSNSVIRKEVFVEIGGFNKALSGYADIELFLRVSHAGWDVKGINQVLVGYRTSTGGMSAQLQKMEEEWYIFNEIVSQYAPDLVSLHHSEAKAYLFRYLARRSLRLRLPPSVGIGFINRSLSSDWRIILKEPRRSLSTLLLAYARYSYSFISFS